MSDDDAGLAGHLFSEGPHRAKEDRLQLFGQFVGDCDIVEERFPQKDGSELRFRGELHWAWILDGLATQDVWMQYDESQKRNVPVGTTIRFHDEGIDAWRSIWIAPGGSIIRTFIGRKDGLCLHRHQGKGSGAIDRVLHKDTEYAGHGQAADKRG